MVVPGFISNGKFVFLLIFFIPDSAFSSTFSANILSPFSRIVDSDLVHSVNSATQGAHQLVHRFNNKGPFKSSLSSSSSIPFELMYIGGSERRDDRTIRAVESGAILLGLDGGSSLLEDLVFHSFNPPTPWVAI